MWNLWIICLVPSERGVFDCRVGSVSDLSSSSDDVSDDSDDADEDDEHSESEQEVDEPWDEADEDDDEEWCLCFSGFRSPFRRSSSSLLSEEQSDEEDEDEDDAECLRFRVDASMGADTVGFNEASVLVPFDSFSGPVVCRRSAGFLDFWIEYSFAEPKVELEAGAPAARLMAVLVSASGCWFESLADAKDCPLEERGDGRCARAPRFDRLERIEGSESRFTLNP